MMRTHFSALFVVCALAFSTMASAQSDVTTDDITLTQQRADVTVDTAARFGVAGYWAMSNHVASFRTLPPIENCCNGFGNTTGYGFGADVFVREMVDAIGMPLTARIGYRQYAAPFMATTTEKAFDGSLKTADALIEHTLDLAWHQFTFGVGVDVKLFDPLYLSVGFDASYTVDATYSQSERLVTPTTMTFETGSDTRNIASGSLTEYNAINMLLDLGLRLRLFQLNSTAVVKDQQWVDLRGRYMLQLTPTYNLPAEGTEPARSLKSNLLTLGLEFTL